MVENLLSAAADLHPSAWANSKERGGLTQQIVQGPRAGCPQNVLFWPEHYFQLKVNKTQQVQKKLSSKFPTASIYLGKENLNQEESY